MENKSKDKSRSKNSEKPSKANKISKEIPKKSYKLVFRKLPFQDFTLENFQKCISSVCDKLGCNPELLQIDHFIQGKLSRKHGPVHSAGFVCVKDEELLKNLLLNCPVLYPFIEDDLSNQPELSLAPYQKNFRTKEKVDKYIGTYETDPEYEKFLKKIESPAQRLPSAETMLDSKIQEKTTQNNDAKQVPLLKFLRERALKKQAERAGSSRRSSADASSKHRGRGSSSLLVSQSVAKNSNGSSGNKATASSASRRDKERQKESGNAEGGKEKKSRRGGGNHRRDKGDKGDKTSKEEKAGTSGFAAQPPPRPDAATPVRLIMKRLPDASTA